MKRFNILLHSVPIIRLPFLSLSFSNKRALNKELNETIFLCNFFQEISAVQKREILVCFFGKYINSEKNKLQTITYFSNLARLWHLVRVNYSRKDCSLVLCRFFAAIFVNERFTQTTLFERSKIKKKMRRKET